MEPARAPEAVRSALDSAVQWWFNALDQRRIRVRSGRWVVQVTGIHTDGADLWIQIAPAGHLTRSLVVHVSVQTTIDEAVAALEAAWSERRTDRTVIDLTRAA